MNRKRTLRRAGVGGFTLLELLVASSLLAILAILSWRGLDSVLKTRDRLIVHGDALREMTIAFSQMDEDLRRAWPVRMIVPTANAIGFAPMEPSLSTASGESKPNGSMQMNLVREGGSALDPIRLERVSYRLNAGTFERGYQALSPRGEATASWTWQPLMKGVQSVSYRVWSSNQGWVPAQAGSTDVSNPSPGSSTAGAAASPASPVVGVEVVLAFSEQEMFTRVYSVRD